jgi:hypothetical protein
MKARRDALRYPADVAQCDARCTRKAPICVEYLRISTILMFPAYPLRPGSSDAAAVPCPPSLHASTTDRTGVFPFHDKPLENRWYACPSFHILSSGCAFFCLTFPPRICLLCQPCAALQCALMEYRQRVPDCCDLGWRCS